MIFGFINLLKVYHKSIRRLAHRFNFQVYKLFQGIHRRSVPLHLTLRSDMACEVGSQHGIKFVEPCLSPVCAALLYTCPCSISSLVLATTITYWSPSYVVPCLALHLCPRNDLYQVCFCLLYPLHSLDTQKSCGSSKPTVL
jgi:hypothetical protein